MKLVVFSLSMPGVGSWNGKWTGEGRLYAVVRRYPNASRFLENVMQKKSYGYDFLDGWSARIDVKIVDAKDAAQIRKNSAGFCGYDWMIDEIEKYGRIRTQNERYS